MYRTTEGKFVRIEIESFEIHPASRNKSHPKEKKIQNRSEIESRSVPGDKNEEKKRKKLEKDTKKRENDEKKVKEKPCSIRYPVYYFTPGSGFRF